MFGSFVIFNSLLKFILYIFEHIILYILTSMAINSDIWTCRSISTIRFFSHDLLLFDLIFWDVGWILIKWLWVWKIAKQIGGFTCYLPLERFILLLEVRMGRSSYLSEIEVTGGPVSIFVRASLFPPSKSVALWTSN